MAKVQAMLRSSQWVVYHRVDFKVAPFCKKKNKEIQFKLFQNKREHQFQNFF